MTVNTIPPSIHEAFVEKFFARDPSTNEPIRDEELIEIFEAAKSTRITANEVSNATRVILDSNLETPIANAKRARDHGFKLLERAMMKVDAARKRGATAVAAIEKQTGAPPPPANAVDAMLHGEIRARLAKMSDEERASAIASGDDHIIAAYLHGPAMLTGASEAEREMHRRAWQRAKFPAEIDRAERLKKAMAAMERGASLLLQFVAGLTDAEAIGKAEAAERRAQDTLNAAGAA
jgi:hypothetical protein